MTMTGGHKMKNRKIQEQLLIWFLIFTVIPLSVISFWCYLLASRIINQKSSSYAAESIQQLSDNLDQLLVQIENTSLSISYNNYIQNALENLSNGQSISRVDSYQPVSYTHLKRISAALMVILLAGLFIAAIVLAITGAPVNQLMAVIFSIVFISVLFYACLLYTSLHTLCCKVSYMSYFLPAY